MASFATGKMGMPADEIVTAADQEKKNVADTAATGVNLAEYEVPTQAPQAPLPPMETPQAGAEAAKLMKDAIDQSKAAADKMGKAQAAEFIAGAQSAAQQAGAMKQTQIELQKIDQENEKKEQERQNVITQKRQELESFKINPDRFWASRTTGQKVLAGFAMLMGAAGPTGQNAAVQAIDKAIDDDIALQKAEYQKKQNAYGQLLDQFKDKRVAELELRKRTFDNAELKLKELALQSQSPIMKARAEQAMATMQANKAKLDMELGQALSKSVQSGDYVQDMTTGQTIQVKDPKDAERFVPGLGFTGSQTSAEKLRETSTTVSTAKSSIKELLNMLNEDNKSLTPTMRAKGQTLASMLKGQLRTVIVGPGAVSESEWKLLNDIVANPAEVLRYDPATKARLQTLEKTLSKHLASQAKLTIVKQTNPNAFTASNAQELKDSLKKARQ